MNKGRNSPFLHYTESITRVKSKIPKSSSSGFMDILFFFGGGGGGAQIQYNITKSVSTSTNWRSEEKKYRAEKMNTSSMVKNAPVEISL